jgi:uncharacterized protein (DUF2336 family)
MNERLSQADIEALLQNPDSSTKINIIQKITAQYKAHDMTDNQVALAEQIFRLLLKQAEVEVRTALSESLMDTNIAPLDVIQSLARDVKEVALPVLEFSEVLTDDDLVNIIQTSKELSAQLAITRRHHVSETVSSALVHTKNEQVVQSLLKNEGSDISQSTFVDIIGSFKQHDAIVEAMLLKSKIPSSILTQLTHAVSDELRKKLEYKYHSNFQEIGDFFREMGEIASLKFHERQTIDTDLIKLVDSMEQMGQLEASLEPTQGQLAQLLAGLEQHTMLHPFLALERGHKTMFEVLLARATSIPLTNIRKLIADKINGYKALYEKAQLPARLYDASLFLLQVIEQMETEHSSGTSPRAKDDVQSFISKTIQLSKGRDIPNLAHFVSIMRRQTQQKNA